MSSRKFEEWISKHIGLVICMCIFLGIGMLAAYRDQKIYWETEVKCKVEGCQNDGLTDHDYCKDHTCQHEDCYNLRVDDRIYCEAHIHCKYENFWRTLREGEVDYCERHQKVITRREYEAWKKEKSEQKAREAAREVAQQKKKDEEEQAIRRQEHMAINRQRQAAAGKSWSSYDSGYNGVYDDGDYDDRRYRKDSEYANGVDDAIDELGDDWQK